LPLIAADIYGLKLDRSELGKDPAFYNRRESTNILSTYQSISKGMFFQLMSKDANQADHARIRKMLAPAFSDRALLEQESLLTHYFDLLVSELKKKIDGPNNGRVDMMEYYNFVTFDITGQGFRETF
jgi:cytochrome P450